MHRLCVMLLEVKWAALVTALRSPRGLATKMGKLSSWRDVNPCKECIALGRRQVLGSNSDASKIIFFREISILVDHRYHWHTVFTTFWKRFAQYDGGSVGLGTQKLKGLMRMWGSIAQWLACLLPDSAAQGSTPSIPKKISEEKMSMMLRLIKGAG